MKKYILGMTMVSMLSMVGVSIGMNEKKKEQINTSLSSKQVSELRQAMIDYKKDRSRSKQEKIITKYKNDYPNDPFVKAKLNEKARFDNPEQPQVKKEPAKKQTAKKQTAKKEVNAVQTSLTAKQQAELKKAVQGIKDKPLSESRKEQLIIQSYLDQADAGDLFAKAQLKEASRIYKLKKYGPDYRDPFDDSDTEDM